MNRLGARGNALSSQDTQAQNLTNFANIFSQTQVLTLCTQDIQLRPQLGRFADMATPAIEASVKEEDVLMTEPSGVSNPKEIKNALYARCASLEEDHVFDQEELLSFNVIPNNDVAQLLKHSQQLAKEGLFKVMTKNGKICWRVVNRKEAAKYDPRYC